MAISPDIRDQAYKFFVEEAPELLQVLEVGLLSLHKERSTAKVHSLMRAAHTLKGGASSVGLDAIATLAHRLENVLRAFYDETFLITTELQTYLLQAYDCLRLPLMEQITTGSFDVDAALAIADPIFSQLETQCADALSITDQYIPSSAALGANLIKDIFTVNIAQGIERLAKVVGDPDHYQVAGELRAQAEVFAGFAEFLNVPEFGSIAKIALQALEAHPNQALEITRLALADFERSRTRVLSGDDTHPAGASSELVALAKGTTNIVPASETLTAGEFSADHQVEDLGVESDTMEVAALESQGSLNCENSLQLIHQNQINLSSKTISSGLTTSIQDNESSGSYGISPSLYVHPVELSSSPSLTVRVDSERLESMNNLVGELIISREGLVLQNEQTLRALRNLRQGLLCYRGK